jgi:hypothetical protein
MSSFELNSDEGAGLLKIAYKSFGDFRNKFLDRIDEIVDMIKEKRAQ